MKSFFSSVAVFLIALLLTNVVPISLNVLAQTAMTDAHVAHIKANCAQALVTLGQIHANDAPVYINHNQTYFSISDKLMARFNSRLSSNHYDGTQLRGITTDYNDALAKFRTAYKIYDDIMSDVVHMDCTKTPVSFFDRVGDAHDARQKVNDITIQLSKLITKYQDGVQAFKDEHFPAGKVE